MFWGGGLCEFRLANFVMVGGCVCYFPFLLCVGSTFFAACLGIGLVFYGGFVCFDCTCVGFGLCDGCWRRRSWFAGFSGVIFVVCVG